MRWRVPERDSIVVDAAHAPATTAATASRTMRAIISDLDVDDATEPEPADDRQHDRDHQPENSDEVVEQRLEVVGLDEPDGESEHGRDQAQDDRRHPAFGGERAELAADAF